MLQFTIHLGASACSSVTNYILGSDQSEFIFIEMTQRRRLLI